MLFLLSVGLLGTRQSRARGGGDDWLIVYRTRRRVGPQQVSAFLDQTFEVRGVFAKR